MNFAEILQGHDLSGTNERVGFILNDGNVVECENVSANPATSFRVAPKAVRLFAGEAVATWHTHPGASANLSTDDFECFHNWKSLRHIIIGEDGIAVYYFDQDGELLRE